LVATKNNQARASRTFTHSGEQPGERLLGDVDGGTRVTGQRERVAGQRAEMLAIQLSEGLAAEGIRGRVATRGAGQLQRAHLRDHHASAHCHSGS
jgi:hypothetical protein